MHRFNPRAPCGARLLWRWIDGREEEFQSTRPVWGATLAVVGHRRFLRVSIHAPRVGRDPHLRNTLSGSMRFNPRAPCGARHVIIRKGIDYLLVSIHAPRVGRDTHAISDFFAKSVSIHAPRVGRDGKRGNDFPPLPRIYGYSPPQIRFSRHLRPTPLLRHDSRTYIFTFCFLFTSPSHSVINAQMIMAASKS